MPIFSNLPFFPPSWEEFVVVWNENTIQAGLIKMDVPSSSLVKAFPCLLCVREPKKKQINVGAMCLIFASDGGS